MEVKRRAEAHAGEDVANSKRAKFDNTVEELHSREKVFEIPELLCVILHICDGRHKHPPPPAKL